MTAPRRPPSPYSSERDSSARPRPPDWCAGSTTSSERPHNPSRSIASAAPISCPSRSATQAPPGSRSSSWWKRTSAGSGGWGGDGGSCRRSSSSANVRAASSWTGRASSRRIGRSADMAARLPSGDAGLSRCGAGVAAAAVVAAWIPSCRAPRDGRRTEPERDRCGGDGLRLRLAGAATIAAAVAVAGPGVGFCGATRFGAAGVTGFGRSSHARSALAPPCRRPLSWRPASFGRPLPRLRPTARPPPGGPSPTAGREGRTRGRRCAGFGRRRRGGRAAASRRGGAPCARGSAILPGPGVVAVADRHRRGGARRASRRRVARRRRLGRRTLARAGGWVATTPAAVPPPTSATATSALAASAPPPPATAAVPPAAAAPPPAEPEPKAAARAVCLSPSVGSTGSATASARRCAVTAVRNARHPGHSRRCRRSVVRRSAPPRRVASCSRISSHGVSRASRLAISEVRAWNTSAFTFSRGTSSTVAISSWETAPSSESTSAARWSSGRPERSESRSRRSCRRWTSLERCSVGSSSASPSGLSRRARSVE